MLFYRYDDVYSSNNLEPICTIFKLFKETKCGYWIYEKNDWNLSIPEKKKWVSNSSIKRYAYPTKQEAMKSYLARKRRHYLILKGQLNRVIGILQKYDSGLLDKIAAMQVYHGAGNSLIVEKRKNV